MEYDTRQVAEHKVASDAWMTIHGKVYDVTKYLKDHPSGAEVLAEAAGTDATEAFDNAGHSEDAFDIMESFQVGSLKGYKKKPQRKAITVTPAPKTEKPTTSKTHALVSRLGSLGLFSLAVTGVYLGARRYSPATPRWVLSILNNETPGRHGFGFTKGLLAGAGIFAVVDALLAQHLARLTLQSSRSFTSYPAQMKVPEPVREDTLLQRGLLDPARYSPLPLRAKTRLSPNVYRFTFALPTTETVLGLPIGQHVAIKAEVGGESVSRSYTSVSNNADRGVLELVVKVYPDGALTSGYLAGLAVGDEVLFRGPKGAMRYARGLARRVGMVAGGTGITPLFQVIRAVYEDDRDLTQISLVYANRSEEDILLRAELDAFARRYPKQFRVWYLLDRPPAEGWRYGTGYCTQEVIADKLPPASADTKMMLCGPPGLVSAAKNAIVNLGFEKPGAMSKMTDQIFLF